MKRFSHICLLLFLLLPVSAGAQGHVRRAMEKARQRQEQMARKQVNSENSTVRQGAAYLHYIVENGDTTYLDKVPAVWIWGRRNPKDDKSWREYHKLVWRFARVYPFALASGGLKRQVDSTLNAQHYGFIRKERYMNAIQKQLFKDFEGALKSMSIQQGAVLLKLIHRETGVPPYDIIKNYKNGVAAGFWQGVARLFENDLKSGYDPNGADRELEELARIWQRGEFDDLYRSLFWEDPPKITVPASYFR